MILKPKDYIELSVAKNDINTDKEAIKTAIKALVATKPMDYSTIIKIIQKQFNYINDDLHNIIVEVDNELNPIVIKEI